MWICHCNPFDDKAVRKCLDEQKGEFARVSCVYKTCSGGESPNCATCIPHLQSMVMEHNREATVANLAHAVALDKADTPEKSPV